MKKIVSILLLVVVLGMAIQSPTASANDDQFPKVYNTYSISVNHIN